MTEWAACSGLSGSDWDACSSAAPSFRVYFDADGVPWYSTDLWYPADSEQIQAELVEDPDNPGALLMVAGASRTLSSRVGTDGSLLVTVAG